tara:strand:+ start:377 stop:826 length:450 start_codon:yes stop_codon:yes gene_type:complete
MKTRLSLVLAILLIVCGVFWESIKDIVPTIPNTPQVVIEKPEESIINQWFEVSKSIDDENDRLFLCLFNKEFAERVLNYDVSAQDVNDVYVFAAKEVFGDSLKGKYEELSKATKDAMVSILGEENHEVIETEKIDLSKTFMGFAWSLNN